MAAYALEKGGQAEVTAVCRSNYQAVKANGFTIDSMEHGHNITGFRPSILRNTVPDVAREGLKYDYLVASTKNIPDINPTLLDIISPAVTEGHTTILLLQNGLNIEKPIIERFPRNFVLSGVSLIGAAEVEHGIIRHDDSDSTKCGPFEGQSVESERAIAEAKRFIEMYNACGKVNWSFDEDVRLTRWRKLVYNSSYNSVSAIVGMDTPRMRMSESVIDDLVRPAMLEIIAIAKAAGVELPEGVEEEIIRVDPTGTEFWPSMGQDVAKVCTWLLSAYIELVCATGENMAERATGQLHRSREYRWRTSARGRTTWCACTDSQDHLWDTEGDPIEDQGEERTMEAKIRERQSLRMSLLIEMWQVSFERVFDTRQSVAVLLLVMNFCDRQAIPEKLIHKCARISSTLETVVKAKLGDSIGDGVGMIVDTDSGEEFVSDGGCDHSLANDLDEDIAVLGKFPFVASTVDVSVLEIHICSGTKLRDSLKSDTFSLARYQTGSLQVRPDPSQ